MSGFVRRRTLAEHERLRSCGESVLSHLDMELTERCDNDCVHCYICRPEHDEEARQREMTTGEIKAVLGEAAALGALSVRFTGGEPLLRDDFAEVYVAARQLGLKVTLFTNARRITPDLADLLAAMPPLKVVEVSVYGMSEAAYAATSRRHGAYEEFRRGVTLLLERGVSFVVKGALTPALRGEVAEFERWAATIPSMAHAPEYSLFFDLRSRRASEASALSPEVDADERERRNCSIRGVRVAPAEGIAFLARDRAHYLEEMRQFCASFMRPPGDRLFSCSAGLGGCVDAYGVVQPCLALRDPALCVPLRDGRGMGGKDVANVVAGRLRSAIEEAFPRVRDLRARDPEYLRRCARCFLKSLCEQCPAKSWAENGTLDSPVEYLCAVAHDQARDLALLDEGECAWDVEDWRGRLERCGSRG